MTVNINAAFGEITGNNTELAVARSSPPSPPRTGSAPGSLFEIDGQRTSVPIANGSQVNAPVYLFDFLSAARPAAATGAGQPASSTSRRHATRGAPDHRCSRS